MTCKLFYAWLLYATSWLMDLRTFFIYCNYDFLSHMSRYVGPRVHELLGWSWWSSYCGL